MSRPEILIMHTGALGDHVMIWPLIRAMTSAGHAVTLACESGKGRLARDVLGIDTCGIEREVFRSLWMEGSLKGGRDDCAAVGPPRRVVSFLAEETDAAGRVWARNAREVFAPAVVQCIGAPGSASRTALWEQWDVAVQGRAAVRTNLSGPIVIHVGAGGRAKMWSMERWARLAERVRGDGHEVVVIAGEVEHERLNEVEREVFAQIRGQWMDDLGELATAVRGARAFVGADTGPTHLAAQLGVPTLALFGPTDPTVWRPVGPVVHVLSPSKVCAMDWLSVQEVAARLTELLSGASG